VKVFSPENAYVVEQAQGIKNPEGSNEAIDKRRDGGYSTGVIVHGMLFKGFFRNLGGPVSSSEEGVPENEETRNREEAQVVGSIHSTEEAG
jgi:hypothetical protein